ncbi:MAG: formimidoylglutamase [Agriterribacter sp.]
MPHPHFRLYKRQDILNITRLRRYETKLGECLQVMNDLPLQETIAQTRAKFILLGIPEDIGVLGNFGTGGTDTAWIPFLQAFCNVQSTDIFTGEEILVLGHFDFSDIKSLIMANAKNQDELVDACRHAVANIIDNEVEALIKIIVSVGKTPVVIGGGHNNAYPLIKGSSKGLQKKGVISNTQINVINLDAHADYRFTEGRHSGNAFRYAVEEGFLKKYAVIGLHENYNNQRMLDELYSNINIQYSSFEDICLREKLNFRQAVVQGISFTEEGFTGIELDLDCIEQTLSSANPNSGFSIVQARQFVSFIGNHAHTAYLHICEGAAQLTNGQHNAYTGKLISDLVSDFVKANKN